MSSEEYRQQRAAELKLEDEIKDLIREKIRGTDWDCPGGVLDRFLLVMTSIDEDGDDVTVWLTDASWPNAEGMANRVLRDVKRREDTRYNRMMEQEG